MAEFLSKPNKRHYEMAEEFLFSKHTSFVWDNMFIELDPEDGDADTDRRNVDFIAELIMRSENNGLRLAQSYIEKETEYSELADHIPKLNKE